MRRARERATVAHVHARRCKLRREIASILCERNGTEIAASFQRFKRDGGSFKEEGFYEREILQQTVCTHLADQYTSEDVARTKLPCYIPAAASLHPVVRNFRGDNAVKIGGHFIVGIIVRGKKRRGREGGARKRGEKKVKDLPFRRVISGREVPSAQT